MDAADTRGDTKNICFGLKRLVETYRLKDARMCCAQRPHSFTFFFEETVPPELTVSIFLRILFGALCH
jgi:hypothetical protein